MLLCYLILILLDVQHFFELFIQSLTIQSYLSDSLHYGSIYGLFYSWGCTVHSFLEGTKKLFLKLFDFPGQPVYLPIILFFVLWMPKFFQLLFNLKLRLSTHVSKICLSLTLNFLESILNIRAQLLDQRFYVSPMRYYTFIKLLSTLLSYLTYLLIKLSEQFLLTEIYRFAEIKFESLNNSLEGRAPLLLTSF